MSESILPAELLNFLKSLASESRLNIVLLFLDGEERTVNQITEAVGLSQPATSEHLTVLRQAGVLLSRKEGKEVYFRPDRARILNTLDALNNLLRRCCD